MLTQINKQCLRSLSFRNIHQADLRDRGPNIYVKGEGITLTDIMARPTST